MTRFLRLTPALLVLTATTVEAQVYTRPDTAALERAAAFAEMTVWVETTHGTSEQSVMLRNNSRRLVQVMSYEIYNCINIPTRVCKVHEPGPVVKPGKTIRLVTVSRRRDEDAWSYSYKFSVAYVRPPLPAADSALRQPHSDSTDSTGSLPR
jgi:hypothetical protein